MKNKTTTPIVPTSTPATVVPGSYTLGLDLGDRAHQVCAMNANGEIVREGGLPNTRPALAQLLAEFPRATVALEAGTHSPWISRYLTGLGATVLVANPRKLQAISRSERKCDRRDAQMLARLARVDPALLHPIEHGTARAQHDLLGLKLRDALVRTRVNLINAIRFTLKSLGQSVRNPSSESFHKTALADVPADCLTVVQPLLTVLAQVTEQIKGMERELVQRSRKDYPATQRLQQIAGVGPLTALCFVLKIGDPQRFGRGRDAKMKSITTTLIAIATIIAGCSTERQVSRTPGGASPGSVEHEGVNKETADALIKNAESLRDSGDLEASILAYTRAINENAYPESARVERGVVYARLKQYDNAIVDFTSLIQKGAADVGLIGLGPDIYYNRGSVYFETQAYERAISDFNSGISIASKLIEDEKNATSNGPFLLSFKPMFQNTIMRCRYALAEVYTRQKNYKDALNDCDEALRLDPNNADFRVLRKNVESKMEMDEDMKKLFPQGTTNNTASPSGDI